MYYPAASVPPGIASFWYTRAGVFINYGVAVPNGAAYARTNPVSQLSCWLH